MLCPVIFRTSTNSVRNTQARRWVAVLGRMTCRSTFSGLGGADIPAPHKRACCRALVIARLFKKVESLHTTCATGNVYVTTRGT